MARSDGKTIDVDPNAVKEAEIIKEITEGTVGFIEDIDGKARPTQGVGVDKNALKTQDEFIHLLKEVLVELKINNQYQKEIVGDASEIKESDIEIR